jgi:hypothetical protein
VPTLKRKHPNKNYEDLGKMMVNIYESGYIDRNQSYKMSFIKGMLSGLGGVLGATILVALLIWVLSLFHNVPFIDRVVNNVRSTIQTKEPVK